ncbi:MAG TPA: hypothetical protein PKC66_08060 [Leptospiraceae bacterium]|nr:hypothetical protein [Leptospiraceae bacterium]HMY32246.1 hypothetical protein [Leptospiraceae bacterium]HNF55950.1 hypothetical protein [Leptospiraceae bacterium]HNL75015.1 hypothetical protein [Leptospiraceae bacterium]
MDFGWKDDCHRCISKQLGFVLLSYSTESIVFYRSVIDAIGGNLLYKGFNLFFHGSIDETFNSVFI